MARRIKSRLDKKVFKSGKLKVDNFLEEISAYRVRWEDRVDRMKTDDRR
jgi:hypothetical protein